ncbi:DNRLRE domain-containing protein [Actinoplanes oblitus]|uniref:DNRLRE domain-containing protein n=1 Tax=Actinoplanes oblitus TaxID=3040509 RepID=A0ABY8WTS2_9ACTN|nr:DNRLRE domain-containing protein [Actinoplanes oblitus]WIN00049.1 DNRLRE domain-containing protein [Actinoplanes oblitus]
MATVTLVASLVTVPPDSAIASSVTLLGAADEPAAMARARQTGSRVRIDSMTTGTAEFFATPDYRVEARISAGIVRFRRDGSWVPIDLTLQRQADGSIAPKAHPDNLRISGGKNDSSGSLAAVGEGDSQLAMGWTGKLPSPQLSGSRATYPEALPGVDVVVQATATGFEQFLVVKSRAAAQRMGSITLPLMGNGVASISADANGQLRVRDRLGKQLGAIPHPLMWDSGRTNNRPSLARSKRLKLTSEEPAAVARSAQFNGELAVNLKADPNWLSDPNTVYPVTIDPQVDRLLATGSITVVQGYEYGWPDADSIFMGALSDTQAARALIDWDTTALRGMEVTSATANFYSSWAASCDPQPWEIWTTNAAAEGVGWDTQPRWLWRDGTSTASNCDGGWLSIDATAFFQYTAVSNSDRGHMGIRTVDEKDWFQWKQFTSRNGDPSQVPYATVTYSPIPLEEPEWTQEPDVPATDGSEVPVVNPDEEQYPSLDEDPFAPAQSTGVRYALGTAQPLSDEETLEELGADPQLEQVEEGDEPPSAQTSTASTQVAALAAPTPTAGESCELDSAGTSSICTRPATAADIANAKTANPGGMTRALEGFHSSTRVTDGSVGSLSVAAEYSTSASRIPKPADIPQACYNRAINNDTSWIRWRYAACKVEPIHINSWSRNANGVWNIVGTLDYYQFLYMYTKRNSRKWVYQVGLGAFSATFMGEFIVVATTGRGASCSNNCSVRWSLPANKPLWANRPLNGVALIESKVKRGKQSSMRATWKYELTNGAPNDRHAKTAVSTQTVRCDQALKGYPESVGCVVPSVVPTMTYSRTGKFPELAKHIYNAQNSGLPGKYPNGSPLTKLNSSSKSDSNRLKACPSKYPRPSGKSCDEYPMASTYQGAALNGGSGRTFGTCGVSGVSTQATGASGWSLCMINAKQNSVGGRALQTFYSQQRLMNADKFRVYSAP